MFLISETGRDFIPADQVDLVSIQSDKIATGPETKDWRGEFIVTVETTAGRIFQLRRDNDLQEAKNYALEIMIEIETAAREKRGAVK